MKKQIIIIVPFFCATLITQGCLNDPFQGEPKWKFPDELENSYLIPVGRRVNRYNGLEITIKGAQTAFSAYTDPALGNWIVIPKSAVRSDIKLEITNSADFRAVGPADAPIWIQPSALIDSGSPAVREKSVELKQRLATRESIASAIQKYVRENVKHKDYFGHFSKKASETLTMRYGTCVNRARLFAALCRASGVPARTVWGYFYILPEANQEGHHEWAEYLNDDNRWIALELDERLYDYHHITKPDIEYIDLVYAAEENPIFLLLNNHQSTLLYMSTEGNWITGKFGFKIIKNDYPYSLAVENHFEIN
jgi:hypothetical protein